MKLFLLAAAALLVAPLRGERVSPAKGTFLVAKPSVGSGPFHQSVVLLLSHDDTGTFGVIVNRATKIPLAEALPELGGSTSHQLYFGGPVGLEGVLFVFRADAPPEDSPHVMADVYFSGSAAVLEELLDEETSEETLRVFLGHSGWAPGQLDRELLRGDWDVVRADPFAVFLKDPKTLWQELSGEGKTVARLSRSSALVRTLREPEGTRRWPRPNEATARRR